MKLNGQRCYNYNAGVMGGPPFLDRFGVSGRIFSHMLQQDDKGCESKKKKGSLWGSIPIPLAFESPLDGILHNMIPVDSPLTPSGDGKL